ncbi:hypothetical protein LVJ82_00505 [Vitreoscilla massiliensis]|uniref:Uncharacterized protein n=1 Tax=Vitreoscilla massiliensis TaxID=1689272 RepID=A0ABY4E2B2_9NEIS|nr:hypothetical protein [Vitreoscilla massiliensis]UOO89496.1 hypothetical protein LVJ82_00505 [Vitreoscilla massiliensis]
MTTTLTIPFAPYLITYTDVNISINDRKLDPTLFLRDDPIELDVISANGTTAKLKILFWNGINQTDLYLCKSNGAVLYEIPTGEEYKIKPTGYKFSAYLSSEIFNSETIGTIDLDGDARELVRNAVDALNTKLVSLKKEEQNKRKENWIKDGIYPYLNKKKEELTAIEIAQQSVFDIVAVQVEDKLKKFQKSSVESKQFTFKLMAKALEDNPASIQKIIYEVLNLNKEEQEMFASLLDKTSLSSILKSAKVVVDRLAFLDALSDLVFNHKKTLLERDELHKILNNEAWIFDEHFSLSGTEKRLEDALQIHLKLLGRREDESKEPVYINGIKQGRLDLMLHKSVEIRPGYRDFLVVELKRPSQKIDNAVMGQLKGYAQAISNDERFDKQKCKWKLIAISNEFDDVAEMDASTASVRGKIATYGNIELYIMTWSEVLNNAKARLKFYQEQLQFEASDDDIRTYLFEKHEEFLPSSYRDKVVNDGHLEPKVVNK